MNSKQIKLQLQKAELNDEAFRVLDVLGVKKNLIQNNKILLTLKSKADETEETDEWTGIIQSLKVFTKFHFHKSLNIVERIDEKIDIQRSRFNALEAKNDSLENKLESVSKELRTEIGTLDKKFDKLEKSISEMKEDIVLKILMGLESFKEQIQKKE